MLMYYGATLKHMGDVINQQRGGREVLHNGLTPISWTRIPLLVEWDQVSLRKDMEAVMRSKKLQVY